MYKISKKNLKETVLKKYIYFSFKNVYIFLVIIICWLPFFFLKNDQFFLNYFISYFISRKFLFSLVFLFFNEVKTFTVQGGSQMKFFLKTKVEITTVSSESQNKLYECVIFFIFDILDFFVWYWHLGRDVWVYWERMNIYTKSHDDLWECMYEMHSFHLC